LAFAGVCKQALNRPAWCGEFSVFSEEKTGKIGKNKSESVCLGRSGNAAGRRAKPALFF
jgi:hypothetical protein